jgi:hypothetical protein
MVVQLCGRSAYYLARYGLEFVDRSVVSEHTRGASLLLLIYAVPPSPIMVAAAIFFGIATSHLSGARMSCITYIDDRLPQDHKGTIVPDTSFHAGAKPCSCPFLRPRSTTMVSLINILCGTQAGAASHMIAFSILPDSRRPSLRASSSLRCDVLACLCRNRAPYGLFSSSQI